MQAGNDKGFTLIEVMIAILLTVIAIIGILAMYMSGSRSASYTRHTTEAATLANDKLEELRTTTTPAAGTQTTIDGLGRAGGIFERHWTVTTVGTSYQDITVYVGWDEDEQPGAACAAHSTCVPSRFCRSNGRCAGRAVVVNGRRNQ